MRYFQSNNDHKQEPDHHIFPPSLGSPINRTQPASILPDGIYVPDTRHDLKPVKLV